MAERVLVLGGGIIGLASAFEAAGRGCRVTVVESGLPGGQASGAAAGMLAPYAENTDGPDPFFHLCRESLRRYPTWIERIEEASGRAIEWTPSGSLSVVWHEADLAPLRTRMLWQNEYGAGAELLDASELRRMEPLLSRDAAAALYCPRESHVYAPALVAALETACRRIGVDIADRCGAVNDISLTPSGAAVRTANRGRLTGDRLVVCTGAWTAQLQRLLGLPLPVHPIRGQICAYEAPAKRLRHIVFSAQAYWCSKGNGTLVCGASEDVAGFDSSVTERGIGRLVRCSARALPALSGREPSLRWAGLRPATRDGLPLIGAVPEAPQAIVAAGHYRNGILLGPVTAAAVADLLAGRPGPVPLAPFAPDRFAPVGGGGAR